MESLYTKYRPQTFEQVVGQTHVVETLKRAVLEGRTSHAYLFCGPRGTGKTTMARLLAKALMCEKGPDVLPDGTCDQCRLIAAGEHPDVVELDAASRTGVDAIRDEIISRVNYAPTLGRCRVYIIDEVHMLTPAAFNALLKTLEEPPEHVSFVMCTTDPQKILATILSRVQRFDFRSIGNDEMHAHLAHVCEQEGFSYEDDALDLVVRHARGGMRDALTVLEQLSVFGDGSIDAATASEFLGGVTGSVMGEMGMAMARRDVPALFSLTAKLADSGRDLLQVVRELSAHVRDVYAMSVAPSATDVVSGTQAELDDLRREAAAFGSPDRAARVMCVLADASGEMRTAPNQRLVLEIALTRIARPESDLTLESLADRVASLEAQLAAVQAGGAPVAAPAAQQPAAGPQPAPTAPAVQKPAAAAPASAPAPTPMPAQQPVAAPAPAAAPAPRPTAATPRPRTSRPAAQQPASQVVPRTPSIGSAAELQRRWKQVVERMTQTCVHKGALLASSKAVSDANDVLTIELPAGSRFASRMLDRPDVRSTLDSVVGELFGRRRVVVVESSLAQQSIARAERGARPAPQPAPAPVAAPAPASAPMPTPAAAQPMAAPMPVPAAQPVATAQPAPAVVAAPAPAPAPAPQAAPAPEYPMPWDEPAAPADDQVPYTDADVASYEDPSAEAAEPFSAPAPTPQPAPAAAPAPAPVPAPSSQPAPAPQPEPTLVPAAAPGEVATMAPDEVKAAVTPEFSEIAAMLADAFGSPVSLSVESAASTSDDEAAAELSQQFDPSEGFVEEPVEDGDDE